MKIALMTHDTRLYSIRRLMEAARERGHGIEPVKTFRMIVQVSPEQPALIHDGRPLEGFDAVIPRIGNSITRFGTTVLRQFELMGAVPLNSSAAILRSRDKMHALQLLANEGVPVPLSAGAIDPEQVGLLAGCAGGPPVVVKPVEGAEGEGVTLAATQIEAREQAAAHLEAKTHFLVQHFYEEARGTDIRAIVAGGEIVAAMKRTGPGGEFRSNLHRGGTAEAAELAGEEKDLSISAVRVLGLDAGGVDILRTDQGPVVLEVNSAPGLEGVETATGVDVAGAFVGVLESLFKNEKGGHGERDRP